MALQYHLCLSAWLWIQDLPCVFDVSSTYTWQPKPQPLPCSTIANGKYKNKIHHRQETKKKKNTKIHIMESLIEPLLSINWWKQKNKHSTHDIRFYAYDHVQDDNCVFFCHKVARCRKVTYKMPHYKGGTIKWTSKTCKRQSHPRKDA